MSTPIQYRILPEFFFSAKHMWVNHTLNRYNLLHTHITVEYFNYLKIIIGIAILWKIIVQMFHF